LALTRAVKYGYPLLYAEQIAQVVPPSKYWLMLHERSVKFLKVFICEVELAVGGVNVVPDPKAVSRPVVPVSQVEPVKEAESASCPVKPPCSRVPETSPAA
jgi:hypothetical protein